VTAALQGAVELLERSLGYTRVQLSSVRPDQLARPTPCAAWDLRALLGHMDDALEAFLSAARGRVEVAPVGPAETRVEALCAKACALHGAWSAARPVARVAVGDLALEAPVLVATAALEITLHGWDVAQTTGRRTPIPSDVAASLLGISYAVIGEADRGARFASPRPVDADAAAEARLLAWTGRISPGQTPTGVPGQTTSPGGCNHGVPPPGRGLAS
jgi:uncharacterized protein (TIGR03086 family)